MASDPAPAPAPAPRPSAEESLPPSRIVRWLLLGGAILFAVAMYFRYGLHLPPMH